MDRREYHDLIFHDAHIYEWYTWTASTSKFRLRLQNDVFYTIQSQYNCRCKQKQLLQLTNHYYEIGCCRH